MYLKNIILFGFYQILINKTNTESNLTNLRFSHKLKTVLNKTKMVKDMGLLRKKKEKKQAPKKVEKEKSELEILCGDDKKLYEALLYIMLLDPRMLNKTVAETVRQAKKMQREENLSEAAYLYKQAVQLALYEGSVEAVEKFARKYAELTQKELKVQAIAERAVEISQEYYKKYLTEPEEEEKKNTSKNQVHHSVQ